jgi:hypothetical protein
MLTEKGKAMGVASDIPRNIKLIRWTARIWSILLFAFALMVMFSPDPYASGPVPAEDWILLSLWGLTILGLLVAWRWELAGSIFTIVMLLVRELAWIILKGPWLVNFLIFWALALPPAILYLIAWRAEKRV